MLYTNVLSRYVFGESVVAMPEIGIIGGSGLYNILKDTTDRDIKTPYGDPSGKVEIGKVNGVEIAFLPRHGKKHSIPPHKVNYRANIWALQSLGVTRILTVSAVGSLKEELPPGDIIMPDQFIDFTRRRDLTFYDGPEVYHISAADPFCPDLNSKIEKAGKEAGIKTHLGGTYVCIEGPRFSTRAESKMFRQFADIIGMTLVPEINLALEKAMCYSTIATITDYDVWSDRPVDASEVIKTVKENEEKTQKLLFNLMPSLKGQISCNCSRRLEGAKL